MTERGAGSARTGGPLAGLDVVVIGAGFAGLYALHVLRGLGADVRVLEMGDGVGGTWYWNRYPGARCDVESIEYSYSFSPELQQEWEWTELMPAQPEIERYLNHVADRFDLRRDIELATRVTALTFDDDSGRWAVATEAGATFTADIVIAATGCLSVPLVPAIAGLESFAGVTLYTNQFPREGFDFRGKRVAVVGTGSSGVQSIPVVAEQAEHLYVFQRSAAYTRPANNRPLGPGELDAGKAEYDDLRRRQRASQAGVLRFGAVSFEPVPEDRIILAASPEERLRAIDELGWGAPTAWADVFVDLDANRAGAELYAELVRRHVADPATAAALVPHYPMGCKRPILDTGYFDAFNRDNVTLVDLRADPIEEIGPRGVRTAGGEFDVDVILFATGFDAMTGALLRMDIRGRDGVSLRQVWADGPRSYLGLQVAGFPNLFTITGPGSPSVLTNMVVSIEQHVEWIADCLVHLQARGLHRIEATPEAQEAWVDHVASVMEGRVVATSDSCNSWYVGANVPGKKRVYMPYAGGLPQYRERCDAVAAAGYEGFALS